MKEIEDEERKFREKRKKVEEETGNLVNTVSLILNNSYCILSDISLLRHL